MAMIASPIILSMAPPSSPMMVIIASKYSARCEVSSVGLMPSLIVVKPRMSVNMIETGSERPPSWAASPRLSSSCTTSVGM